MEVAIMISRRELLKSSLSGCGAVGAAGALGSLFTRKVFAGGSSAGPVVRTTPGKLRGAFANGVYSFKGIHYGASTEGSMRFRPPSRPKPWTGVRDAFEVGPPAPQDRAWTDSAPDLARIISDMTGCPACCGHKCGLIGHAEFLPAKALATLTTFTWTDQSPTRTLARPVVPTPTF